jgi:hypothetical protein
MSTRTTRLRSRSAACRLLIGVLTLAAVASAQTSNPPPSAAARPAGYAAARAAALRECQTIDADASQTGLLFNPDGYRSYFRRSECLQRQAVIFRDPTVCKDVRERTSLFFSSWGYSPKRCAELVAQGIATDERELSDLRHRYESEGMAIRGFRIERNGNGRDYDVLPTFTGRLGHRYTLTFELAGPGDAVQILTASTYLDPGSNLRLYLPRTELTSRFPGLREGLSYRVRALATLDVGEGGASGRWSPEFIDRLFPLSVRSSSVERTVRF